MKKLAKASALLAGAALLFVGLFSCSGTENFEPEVTGSKTQGTAKNAAGEDVTYTDIDFTKLSNGDVKKATGSVFSDGSDHNITTYADDAAWTGVPVLGGDVYLRTWKDNAVKIKYGDGSPAAIGFGTSSTKIAVGTFTEANCKALAVGDSIPDNASWIDFVAEEVGPAEITLKLWGAGTGYWIVSDRNNKVLSNVLAAPGKGEKLSEAGDYEFDQIDVPESKELRLNFLRYPATGTAYVTEIVVKQYDLETIPVDRITLTGSVTDADGNAIIYSGFKSTMTATLEGEADADGNRKSASKKTVTWSAAGTGATIDESTGVLTVDKIKVNAQDYSWVNTGTTGLYRVFEDKKQSPGTAICNVLPVTTYRTSNRIAFTDDETTRSEKRDLINSGSVDIVYTLAAPATYQLTPSEVRTLLGTNNIWADTGDAAVSYRADIGLYVDKKIAELQALVLENQ